MRYLLSKKADTAREDVRGYMECTACQYSCEGDCNSICAYECSENCYYGPMRIAS